jgi:hypothetical protein
MRVPDPFTISLRSSLASIGHFLVSGLFGYNRDHVFVGNDMAQANSLRDMSGTRPPHHCVSEVLLQSAVNLVANVFNGRVATDDECL